VESNALIRVGGGQPRVGEAIHVLLPPILAGVERSSGLAIMVSINVMLPFSPIVLYVL